MISNETALLPSTLGRFSRYTLKRTSQHQPPLSSRERSTVHLPERTSWSCWFEESTVGRYYIHLDEPKEKRFTQQLGSSRIDIVSSNLCLEDTNMNHFEINFGRSTSNPQRLNNPQRMDPEKLHSNDR